MVSKRMKSTPAMACLKTLLTIFSFIFVVIGIGFLVAGVLAKVKFVTYLKLSTINFATAPWVMIGIGSFIVVVGIIGCCATIKGNTCLLRTYGLLLGIIFVCQLGGAIAAIIFKGKIDVGFQDGMAMAVKSYNTNKEYKEAMNDAQSTLHCCGVDNYTEWWTMGDFQTDTVPMTCCSNKTWCDTHKSGENINLAGSDPSTGIYVKGCHALIFDMVNSNLGIIIGTMFGVAFFQVIGLILACCLASTINSNKYELV